jgi:hypothetical protein|tara:strand:+ start:913 stop:1068 length:156 start_codon:yes stop_codon:yes gene_type:complete
MIKCLILKILKVSARGKVRKLSVKASTIFSFVIDKLYANYKAINKSERLAD